MKGKYQISKILHDVRANNYKYHNKKRIDKNTGEFIENEEVPSISFISLYRYVTGINIFILLFGLICALISGIIEIYNTFILGKLTSDFIEHVDKLMNTNLTKAENLKGGELLTETVSDFAITVSILGLLCTAFNWLSIVAFNYIAKKQILAIRDKFFYSVLNQDISWHDKNTTGNFATKMSEDLIKLEDGIGEKVYIFVNNQVIFIGNLILSLIIRWEIVIACSTLIILQILSTVILNKFNTKLAKEEAAAYNSAGVIADEVLSSIKTVAAFGGEKKESDCYKEKLENARKINLKRTIFIGIGGASLWISYLCIFSFVTWYGALLLATEKNENLEKFHYIRTIITVLFCINRGVAYFNCSYPLVEIFGIATGAGAKIFQIISNTPTINASKNTGIKPSVVKGTILFQDVHFHYPSRSQVPILRGLNLKINAGETVALVGSSGCGKSTCVKLIQRFYDLTSGSIHLDDNNIRDLNLIWLRSNIGFVDQEPKLFCTTIAENIKFSYRDATQEDIEKAAKTANVHDFIKSLPLGYNTVVGERGTQLSGGQKQRIAIARALVRNPAIILLDEATSALDANSEAKVQAALDQASKERTTIIVAHRLSTIRNADQIVVLSEGKVVEKGKHDDLMALKGEYYKLVTTQNAADNMIDSVALEVQDDEEELTYNNQNISIHLPSNEEKGNNTKNIELKNLSSIMILWEILKINAPEWLYILIASIFSILLGFSVTFFAILYGEIIRELSSDYVLFMKSRINYYCMLMALLGICTGIFAFIQIFFYSLTGGKLVLRLRTKMFKNILQQDITWFDSNKNGTGALCSRLSLETAHIQSVTGQSIAEMLKLTSALIIGVVFSLYYNYKLGSIILLMIPLLFVLMFIQNKIIKQFMINNRRQIEKANNIAVDAISNIRTVVSLGCEDVFHNNYTSELVTSSKNTNYSIFLLGLIFGFIRSISYFVNAIFMYYGAILVKNEGLSFIDIFKVTQIMLLIAMYIIIGYSFVPNLQRGLASTKKIIEYINLKPSLKDYSTAHSNNWKQGNIKYDRINFSYPTRQEIPVLRDFSLAVAEGKTIALVGPSGCGKSTIIQLLQRFYDPQSGQITIDEDDIKNVTLHKLRSQIGVVSQEATLFDQTVAENIAYGDNSRVVTKAEIIAAAQLANIHNFIVSLPLGYETKMGKDGVQISGGQKQRIAIARALIRDPKILLLDEATSALDTENEKIVQKSLDDAKKNRTCITIAHRLTTIQNAETICVINKGKIVELGSHNELMNQGGFYYKLHAKKNL